jgi:hypothetical protein
MGYTGCDSGTGPSRAASVPHPNAPVAHPEFPLITNFLDRIPFLTKHQGKRELIFVILLAGSIMIAGLVMAQIGWLYKDVPTSTPTSLVATPSEPTETPMSTPDLD